MSNINPLKSCTIHGEHCLYKTMNSEERLHQFHMGMIQTNPSLELVPFHLGYVEGQEALIYNVTGLLPIRSRLEKMTERESLLLMKKLGERLLILMDHQLSPNNIAVDGDSIFIEPQSGALKLVYMPLQNECFVGKSGLETLLLEWIEVLQSHVGLDSSLSSGEFISLLLKMREPHLSLRQLAQEMSRLNKDSKEETFVRKEVPVFPTEAPRAVSEAPIAPAVPSKGKVKKEKNMGKKVKKEVPLKKPLDLKLKKGFGLGKVKILIGALVGLGLAIVGFVFLLTDFDMTTKLGFCLVAISGLLYVFIKLRAILPTPAEAFVEEQVPLEPVAVSVVKPVVEVPRTVQREEPKPPMVQSSQNEETMFIGTSKVDHYILIRSGSEPVYMPLSKEVTSIGRNPAICEILLDEAGIGRLHAEIHKNEDKVYIKDIHSVNGTLVNGRRITSNQYFELKKGDQIQIGTRELVFT